MTGASSPGGRPSGSQGGGPPPTPHDSRDLLPRDFGRDGVSGLVNVERAMRARDVSRPGPEEEKMAADVIDDLLARIDGRRPGARRPD